MFHLMNIKTGGPHFYDLFETIQEAYKYIQSNHLTHIVRPVFADKESYPQFKHNESSKMYREEKKWTILDWLNDLLNPGNT